MAGDRVDIEINDRIDGSVVTKLREIVNEATAGHAAVRKLKAAVDSINARAFNVLATAASKLTGDIDRQALAQARLQTETARASLTAARAATEQQRLATETERTAAASARAAAAQASQAAAQQRAAQAATGAAAAQARTTQATNAAAAAATKHAGSTKLQGYQLQNLIFQLNDVVVGLASGQKPMTVLLQQGSQIATIFPPGTNAIGALARMVGSLVVKFAPLIAIVAGVGIGLGALTSEIQKFTGVNVGLGDTVSAIFQVFSQRIANAIENVTGLKDAFGVAYNFIIDTLRNLVLGSTVIFTFLGKVLADFPNALRNAIVQVYNFLVDFVENAVNLAIDGVNILIAGLNALPGLVGAKLIDPIQKANFEAAKGGLIEVTDLSTKWQSSVVEANAAVNTLFADIARQAAANAQADTNKKRAAELAKVNLELDTELRNMRLLSDARTVQNRVDAIANKFIADKIPLTAQELAGVRARIQEIQNYQRQQKAMDRILEDAKGPQLDYNATVAAAADLVRRHAITEQQRAQAVAVAARALALANDPMLEYKEGLQDAIALTQYFGDELTAHAAVQREVNKARSDGRTLTDDQVAAMLDEQRALINLTNNQTALNQAYQAIAGPARDYNAQVLAATQLIGKFGITEQQVAEFINRTRLAYEDSLDPMRAYNREVEQQMRLAKTYGDNVAIVTAQQQAYHTELAAGRTTADFATFAQSSYGQAIAANVTALTNQARVQQSLNQILQDNTAQTFFQDNYAAMYAEIDRLRQQDLISHRQAEQAKAQIQANLMDERLRMSKDFFGAFTGLQASGNKKIAAIGKAAAITTAIIDGVLATQKALSAFPPPYNYIAAAGVAATAAVNVANIKSQNVGSFKDGGQFTVGGRAGVDANNINMNVTRGERVTIETAAQQRQNDRPAAAGGSPNVTVPVKVVNVIDPEEAIAALNTPAGETAIFNVLQRNPNKVKQIASNA